MASHTCLVALCLASLALVVLSAQTAEEEDALFQLYGDAPQKRGDMTLMDYLMEKRGRGGTTRRCQHNGLTCSCDYRFGPSNSRRYVNCLKIVS